MIGWVSGSPKRTLNSSTFGTVAGHHQACVQKSGEAGCLDGRKDDAIEDRAALGPGEDSRIAVGAHPARIGPGVVIENGLMVLRGLEWHNVPAIAQHDVTDFFAGQEFFNHEGRLQACQRRFGHGTILGNHHAFTGGEAIGFDYDREAEPIKCAASCFRIRCGYEGGCGDVTLLQKVLCKYLTAFEARGRRGGSKDGAAARAECVYDTRHQRSLGPDHRKIGIHGLGDAQITGGRSIAP